MATEEDASARRRIVVAAGRSLQSRGYAEAKLRDIVAEAHAPWGSLHHYFPKGKQQIAVEAVELGQSQVGDLLDQCFARTRSPAAAVARFFDKSRELLEQTDYRFGCPVATVALEHTDLADELASATGAAFEDWITRLETGFRGAGIETRAARRLAVTVLSQYEGALMLSRLGRTLEPMRIAKAVAERLVADAD